jgi:hypothetical protein
MQNEYIIRKKIILIYCFSLFKVIKKINYTKLLLI